MPSLNANLNGGTPNLKLSFANSSTLVKAMLVPWEAGVPKIQFMFNPNELTFECSVETKESPGSRTGTEGTPKPSFSYIDAEKVTISKILFDTYESGEDVVEKYIQPFRAAVRFVGSANQPASGFAIGGLPSPLNDAATAMSREISNAMNQNPNSARKPVSPADDTKALEESKRTPLYRFVWGDQVHLRRCFIAKLTYKLTLFLPDGTPVRAVIDSLTLKKVDEENPSTDLKQAIVDRVKDGIQARLQASAGLRI